MLNQIISFWQSLFRHFIQWPFFIICFCERHPNSGTYLLSKGYKISKSFTGFTIAIRYVFFVFAILAAFLFIRKYRKIPVQDRIIEQKLIGILSIFLIFFNDPLYPITVLKENLARYLSFNLVHFSQHYLWYLLSCTWFLCGSYFTIEFTMKKVEKILNK